MHCRPFCGPTIPTSSSVFVFVRPSCIAASSYQTYVPAICHQDQTSPSSTILRCRRRLEDPITTYASNYYAPFPRQMCQSPLRQSTLSSSPRPPSLSSSRQIYHQSNNNGIYCDLFNLLELPTSSSTPPRLPIKLTRKYKSNDYSPFSYQRPIDVDNPSPKIQRTIDRKRHHQQHSYSNKEKKHKDDKLSSMAQYAQSKRKTKKVNDIYQPASSNRGFFRRIVRNYFCLPSTFANNGYSS